MLGEVSLAAREVSLRAFVGDILGGARYYEVTLPGAHAHPFLALDDCFEGLS